MPLTCSCDWDDDYPWYYLTPDDYQQREALVEWAHELGINPKTLSSRLHYCGMSISDAMTRKPYGKPQNYRKRPPAAQVRNG